MSSLQIAVLKIGYAAGGEYIRKELEIYKVLRQQCPASGPFLQLAGRSFGHATWTGAVEVTLA